LFERPSAPPHLRLWYCYYPAAGDLHRRTANYCRRTPAPCSTWTIFADDPACCRAPPPRLAGKAILFDSEWLFDGLHTATSDWPVRCGRAYAHRIATRCRAAGRRSEHGMPCCYQTVWRGRGISAVAGSTPRTSARLLSNLPDLPERTRIHWTAKALTYRPSGCFAAVRTKAGSLSTGRGSVTRRRLRDDLPAEERRYRPGYGVIFLYRLDDLSPAARHAPWSACRTTRFVRCSVDWFMPLPRTICATAHRVYLRWTVTFCLHVA